MKVTEQHANGAAIELQGTRRAVSEILQRWRDAQAPAVPETPEPEREPDKQGAQAQVENAGGREYEVGSMLNDVPVVQAHTRPSIGFTVRKDDRT